MSKGISNVPDTDPDAGNLDKNNLGTNQQVIVVPLFSGTAKFAAKWISNPFKQFTKDAPVERPGKK